jgi:hypothetical protein
MDAIRIQIIRGCDEKGQGGTVVDDASGVLGSLNGVPIVDLLAAAFESAYGLYSFTNPKNPNETLTVTPFRNISTRMRLYGQEVLSAYASQQAATQAATTAGGQIAEAMSKLTIVENLKL